jgi:hypothetical protein
MPPYSGCIMKKLIPVFALLCAFSAPAFAGPCVALDYQEMKDMSVNELVKEACKANANWSRSFDDAIASPSLSRAAQESTRDYEQCSGQIDRMVRILNSRGVTEKLHKLCEQQAAGQPIQAPAEAK